MIICLLFKLHFSDWISLNHFLSRIEHKVSSEYRNTFSWSSFQVVYNSTSNRMGRSPMEREREGMWGSCIHTYCERPELLHSLRDPHLLPKKPRQISTECLYSFLEILFSLIWVQSFVLRPFPLYKHFPDEVLISPHTALHFLVHSSNSNISRVFTVPWGKERRHDPHT